MGDTALGYVGTALAVISGIFIGSSLILQKKGQLETTLKRNQGHNLAYLKNIYWWFGMISSFI